jgi:hypothetical protein
VRAPQTAATKRRRSGAESATGMSRCAGSLTSSSIERSTSTSPPVAAASGPAQTASTLSAATIASRSARACAA